tara:strand:+ start:833 stop:1024 length:192 start_codon:yes stop_codon:yes gene_type:complete
MGVTLQFIQSNVETSVMVESSSVAQATPSRGVAAAGTLRLSLSPRPALAPSAGESKHRSRCMG